MTLGTTLLLVVLLNYRLYNYFHTNLLSYFNLCQTNWPTARKTKLTVIYCWLCGYNKSPLLLVSFFSDHLSFSFLYVSFDILCFVRKEWGIVTLTMFLHTRLCNHITSPLNAQWENISIRLMNNISWLMSHLWAMMHYKHRVHGEGKQVAHRNKHKLSCYLGYHGLWFCRSRYDWLHCFVRMSKTCQQGLILWYKKVQPNQLIIKYNAIYLNGNVKMKMTYIYICI